MNRIIITILVIGVLLLSACGAPATQLVHYVDREFGYSIDYPEGWLFEKPDPNQIRIQPEDSEYNEIRVIAGPTQAEISSIPAASFAAQIEDGLEQFLGLSGAGDLNIFVNQPASGKWDWEVHFAVFYEDRSLKGRLFIKGDKAILYALALIQRLDWPEGLDVINSFRLTE